jgi:hypothetical protein
MSVPAISIDLNRTLVQVIIVVPLYYEKDLDQASDVIDEAIALFAEQLLLIWDSPKAACEHLAGIKSHRYGGHDCSKTFLLLSYSNRMMPSF